MPPSGCLGYALNVKDKYDGGDTSWLDHQFNNLKEWPLFFHGTQNSKRPVEGIAKKGFIDNGPNQFYSRYKCQFNGETIGNGIYLTDDIQIALEYCKFKQNEEDFSYFVIFQSRARPEKVRKCPFKSYYVVNNTEDVRPYRIILIHKNDENKVKNYEYEEWPDSFKQNFEQIIYSEFKKNIIY